MRKQGVPNCLKTIFLFTLLSGMKVTYNKDLPRKLIHIIIRFRKAKDIAFVAYLSIYLSVSAGLCSHICGFAVNLTK